MLAANHARLLVGPLPPMAKTAEAVHDQFAYHDRNFLYVRVAPDEYAIAMGLYGLHVPFVATSTSATNQVLKDKFACSVFFDKDRCDPVRGWVSLWVGAAPSHRVTGSQTSVAAAVTAGPTIPSLSRPCMTSV